MSVLTSIQTNFTAGELAKRLLGRVDLTKYYNGASLLENFQVFVHGGISRRPGSYFAAEVKDSSKVCRLIKFQFSVTQAYILEFGNLYMRVYRNHAQVLSVGVPVEVVTPWTEAMLPDLKFTQSADVLYVCHPTVRPKTISRTSDTSWTLADFNFLDGPYQSINTSATTMTPSVTTGSGTLTA